MEDRNYVVFKLDYDTNFWDRLSVNLSLKQAKWYRDSCRSTYEGCKFLIVEVIDDDTE